jgi:hypothetical protein
MQKQIHQLYWSVGGERFESTIRASLLDAGVERVLAGRAAQTCAARVARNAFGSSLLSAILVFVVSKNLLAAAISGGMMGAIVGGATIAFDNSCEPVRDSAIPDLAEEIGSGRY